MTGGGLTAFGALGVGAAFAVPRAPQPLELKQGDAKTGMGLFDQWGSHYGTLARPNGFRGIYGEERSEFFLAAGAACSSFQPDHRRPS